MHQGFIQLGADVSLYGLSMEKGGVVTRSGQGASAANQAETIVQLVCHHIPDLWTRVRFPMEDCGFVLLRLG